MLYEYRRYTAVPGRMPDLKARFRERTLAIWRRLGFRPVAFWDPVVGNYNELHYLLAWESLDERQRLWSVFQADAEWQAARAESESRGPLVAGVHNEIWEPTDFSPGLV